MWRTAVDACFHEASQGLRFSPGTARAPKHAVMLSAETSEWQDTALLVFVMLKLCASLDASKKIGSANVLFEGALIEIQDFALSQAGRNLRPPALEKHTRTLVQIHRVQSKITERNQARCSLEWHKGGFSLRTILERKSIQNYFLQNGRETVFGVLPSSVMQFAPTGGVVPKPLMRRTHLTIRNILLFLLRELELSKSIPRDCMVQELIASTLEAIRSVRLQGVRHQQMHDDALIASMNLVVQDSMLFGSLIPRRSSAGQATSSALPAVSEDDLRLFAQELSDSSFVLGSVPPMRVQQASDNRACLYDLPDIGVSNVSADTALFFLKHGGHPFRPSRDDKIPVSNLAGGSDMRSLIMHTKKIQCEERQFYSAFEAATIPQHRQMRINIGACPTMVQQRAYFNVPSPGHSIELWARVNRHGVTGRERIASLHFKEDGELELVQLKRKIGTPLNSHVSDLDSEQRPDFFPELMSPRLERQRVLESVYPYHFGYSKKFSPSKGRLAAALLIAGDPIPHVGLVTKIELTLGKRPMQSAWILGVFKKLTHHHIDSTDVGAASGKKTSDADSSGRDCPHFRLVNACALHIDLDVLHVAQNITVSPPLYIPKGYYLGISTSSGQLFLRDKVMEAQATSPLKAPALLTQLRLKAALRNSGIENGSPLSSTFYFSSRPNAHVTQIGHEATASLYSGLASHEHGHAASLVVPFRATVDQPEILNRMPSTVSSNSRGLFDKEMEDASESKMALRTLPETISSETISSETISSETISSDILAFETVVRISQWWMSQGTAKAIATEKTRAPAKVEIITDSASKQVFFRVDEECVGPGLDLHELSPPHADQADGPVVDIEVSEMGETIKSLQFQTIPEYSRVVLPDTLFEMFSPGSTYHGAFVPRSTTAASGKTTTFPVSLQIIRWSPMKTGKTGTSKIIFRGRLHIRSGMYCEDYVDVIGSEVRPNTIALTVIAQEGVFGTTHSLTRVHAPSTICGGRNIVLAAGTTSMNGMSGILFLHNKHIVALSSGSHLHVGCQASSRLPNPAGCNQGMRCPFTIEMWVFLERLNEGEEQSAQRWKEPEDDDESRLENGPMLASYGATDDGVCLFVSVDPNTGISSLVFQITRKLEGIYRHAAVLGPISELVRWMHIAATYEPPGWEWTPKTENTALRVSREHQNVTKVRPGDTDDSTVFGSISLKVRPLRTEPNDTSTDEFEDVGPYMWDMHVSFSGSVHVALETGPLPGGKPKAVGQKSVFGGTISVECGDVIEFTLHPIDRSASICRCKTSGERVVTSATEDLFVTLGVASGTLVPYVSLRNVGDEVYFVTDPSLIARCLRTPHCCALGYSMLYKDGKPIAARENHSTLQNNKQCGNGTTVSPHRSTRDMTRHSGWSFGQTAISRVCKDLCDGECNMVAQPAARSAMHESQYARKHQERVAGLAMGARILDIRMWSICLSQESVHDRFNVVLSGREPSLAGWWPLREGHGFIGYDHAGVGWAVSTRDRDVTYADGIIHPPRVQLGSGRKQPWLVCHDGPDPFGMCVWSGATSASVSPPDCDPFMWRNVINANNPVAIEDEGLSAVAIPTGERQRSLEHCHWRSSARTWFCAQMGRATRRPRRR